MSTTVVEKSSKKKKKSKDDTETVMEDLNWFEIVLARSKSIMADLKETTFEHYRKIGKIILESGYIKGQWKSIHKKRFMKELKVSSGTFSLFIRLGMMSEEQFKEITDTYSSLNEWYRQGKPKAMSKLRQKILKGLSRMFPEQADLISEILRVEKPLLKEKDLLEYSKKVHLSRDDPFTVFIKYFYMPEKSRIKLPNWIEQGVKLYIEQNEIDQPLEAVVISLLGNSLKSNGIDEDSIVESTKKSLREEWGLI